MTKNKGLLTGIAILSALSITAILLVRIAAGEARSLISEFISTSTGYELIIAGGIAIDFFPDFELTMEDVRLRNQGSSLELASAPEVTLKLQIASIFNDEINVQEVRAKDLHINVFTSTTGRNIWQLESSGHSNEITGDHEPSTSNYNSVLFEKIQIANASIDIQDATLGYRYALSNLNSEINNSNLLGIPFKVDSTFNFLNNGMTDPLPISLQSEITFDAEYGKVAADDISILISPMLVTGAVDISYSNDDPSYEGNFESNTFDVITLIQTLGFIEYESEFSGEAEPTETFNFSLDFEGNGSQLAIDRFVGNLGETDIQASGDIRFSNGYGPSNSRYDIRTSSIDLSPFLSVTADKVEPDQSFSSRALRNEKSTFDLPLDTIKELNLLGSIAIESVTANDLAIENVNLFTNIEDGVLDVELQPTNLYGGNVQGLFRVDTNPTVAQLITQLSVEELNLNELSSIIKQKIPAEGQLNVQGNYEAHGINSEELLNTLGGTTSFSVSENSIDISLIKQLFTEIATLSPTGESIQQWPDVIRFSEVEGYVLLENGLSDGQEVNLHLDNLNLNGTGGINLGSNTFNYDLNFSFLPPPQTQTIPVNELYHNVSWPVQCGASFDSEISQYCRPDFTRVREIFAQLGANAVQQEIEEEINERVPQFLQEPARRILRNILN